MLPSALSQSERKIKSMNWGDVKFTKDEATYGSWLIRQGTRSFKSWSASMVAKYGDSIREKLRDIRRESEIQAAAVDAMEQESRDALGPSNWRPLEEAAWSNNQRGEDELLSLMTAFKDVHKWSSQRLKHAVETVTVLTVNRIFGEMLPFPEAIREQCRNVTTTSQALEAAQEASTAALEAARPPLKDVSTAERAFKLHGAAKQMSWAASEAGWGAIRAAWTFAELAGAAAKASEAASACGGNPDDILCNVCQIWIEAANNDCGDEF
jgi:hypothetical protein